MMNFNQEGKLLPSDIQLVESGITNGLEANILLQAIRLAAFVCEREGYNLALNQYDRWQSLQITFEFNG